MGAWHGVLCRQGRRQLSRRPKPREGHATRSGWRPGPPKQNARVGLIARHACKLLPKCIPIAQGFAMSRAAGSHSSAVAPTPSQRIGLGLPASGSLDLCTNELAPSLKPPPLPCVRCVRRSQHGLLQRSRARPARGIAPSALGRSSPRAVSLAAAPVLSAAAVAGLGAC